MAKHNRVLFAATRVKHDFYYFCFKVVIIYSAYIVYKSKRIETIIYIVILSRVISWIIFTIRTIFVLVNYLTSDLNYLDITEISK